MAVHASPDPLPELQEFLDHLQTCFHRPQAKTADENARRDWKAAKATH